MDLKQPTRGQAAMAAAMDALLSAGFSPDGQTREEVVRVPTSRSPVFGRSGGELARFGGRQRFVLGDTTIKATVGMRTVAVYRVDGPGLAGVTGIATLNTDDIEQLRVVISRLVPRLEVASEMPSSNLLERQASTGA